MVFKLLFTLMVLGASAAPAMSATVAHSEPCPSVTAASLLLSHDCEPQSHSNEVNDVKEDRKLTPLQPHSAPGRPQPSLEVRRELIAHNLDKPELAIHYFAPKSCPEGSVSPYSADDIPNDQIYVLLCNENGVDYLLILVGPKADHSRLSVREIREAVHDISVDFVYESSRNEQEALDEALTRAIEAITSKSDSEDFWGKVLILFGIVGLTSPFWTPIVVPMVLKR